LGYRGVLVTLVKQGVYLASHLTKIR